MTSIDKEPEHEGRQLTGKDYMEDLRRHLDVLQKMGDNVDAKKAIPRRRQIYRIAEKIIAQLNELEVAFETNPNSAEALKLIKLHHYYSTSSVEDLAMKMAEQYEEEQKLEEFKSLTKQRGDKNAIIDFTKLKDIQGVPDYARTALSETRKNEIMKNAY